MKSNPEEVHQQRSETAFKVCCLCKIKYLLPLQKKNWWHSGLLQLQHKKERERRWNAQSVCNIPTQLCNTFSSVWNIPTQLQHFVQSMHASCSILLRTPNQCSMHLKIVFFMACVHKNHSENLGSTWGPACQFWPSPSTKTKSRYHEVIPGPLTGHLNNAQCYLYVFVDILQWLWKMHWPALEMILISDNNRPNISLLPTFVRGHH